MESLTFVALFKVRSNKLPYSTCSFVDVQKNTKKNRKMSRKKRNDIYRKSTARVLKMADGSLFV